MFDFGTASGFLAFSAEQGGAKSVTAFDTSSSFYQDRVPYHNELALTDKAAWAVQTDPSFTRMHNSFWYMWHHYKSQVGMVYGSNQDLILTNEKFDVVIAGAVMEHIADPVSALGLCARLAKEALVLAFTPVFMDDDEYLKPLVPWTSASNNYTWWALSKKLYERVLSNLGFDTKFVPVEAELVADGKREMIPRQTIIATRR